MRDLLESKYQGLEFELIVILPLPADNSPWDLRKIKNFCVDTIKIEWHEKLLWAPIFSQLDFIKLRMRIMRRIIL